MAVSSLKGCWSKLSARIRDYIDVVDSYYRPADEVDGIAPSGDHVTTASHHDHRPHRCGRKDCPINSNNPSSPSTKERRNMTSRSSRHQAHQFVDGSSQYKRSLHMDSEVYTWPATITEGRLTGGYPEQQFILSPESLRHKNSLPSGYTKRKTAQGQVYFVDKHGSKDWHDPSVPKELLNATLDLDSLIGLLPTNWEVKVTASGRVYYVNHTKRTTQFTDPRLVSYRDQLMAHLRRRAAHRGELQANSNGVSVIDQQTADMEANLAHNSRQQRLPRRHIDRETQPSPSTNLSPSCRSHRSSNLSSPRAAFIPQSISQNQSDQSPRRSLHGSTMNLSARRNDVLVNATLDTRVTNNFPKSLHRGSQLNLNTSSGAGQSNTFSGPAPVWLMPNIMVGGTRKYPLPNSATARPSSNTISRESNKSPTSTNQANNDNNNEANYQVIDENLANACEEQDNKPNAQNSNNVARLAWDSPALGYLRPDSARSKELADKISLLRQELLKQQILSHACKIALNRDRIFEESYRTIAQMTARDLKKRLIVKFKGEQGLDYGGVAREWFYLLSREILNPVHGLFQYTSDDIYNLQINPDSGIVYREHLSYLNFCGRVIGMAVFHGHFIDGHFTLPFYKMLLGKTISLKDIEFVDPELYSSLCWILENDKTDMIDTTFLVQHNAFGQLQEYELKKGGRNIAVTEANKHEYVSLYVNYRCRRGIEHQFEALQRGFYELIPPHLLSNFDEHELELLIGGLSKIDVDDWRFHTKLKNCSSETPLIIWFWDIVKSYSEERRARLLQFVTGSPRVPIQGFKALQGFNSEPRLFTIHMIRNANTNDLPKSHTCFNRIDIPPYETYEKLRDKLTQAIEETIGFAMQ